MNLENVMSQIDKLAVGPPRTYTFDEWIGGVESFQCPNCRNQEVNKIWHFCPNCGRGLRPIPHDCDPSRNGSIDPIITVSVKDNGYSYAVVSCPKCGQRTKSYARVPNALAAWNYDDLETKQT